MKKRGISPLIASVLLIAFVILLFVLISIWVKRAAVSPSMQKGEEKAASEFEAMNTEVGIESAKVIGKNIKLTLTNRGSTDIKDFSVRIIGDKDIDVVKVGKGLKELESTTTDVGFDETKTGIIEKIEVIPVISSGAAVSAAGVKEILSSDIINDLSCLTIHQDDSSLENGIYSIDPDGPGNNEPFDVYCDMRVYFILNNQPNQNDNLLDSSTWLLGSTGSQPGFYQNGANSENSIELGIGPYGKEVALWKGGNDAISDGDGGWNTAVFTVDTSKAYRYTVWVKKRILSGTTYMGLESNVGLLGGGLMGNPYFWCGQVPQADRWYLIVGYIRPYDTSITTGGIGGVYDGVTKQKVMSFTSTTGNCYSDYKHSSSSDTTQNHRAYLFYDTNINNRQWFYDPRVEVEDSLN